MSLQYIDAWSFLETLDALENNERETVRRGKTIAPSNKIWCGPDAAAASKLECGENNTTHKTSLKKKQTSQAGWIFQSNCLMFHITCNTCCLFVFQNHFLPNHRGLFHLQWTSRQWLIQTARLHLIESCTAHINLSHFHCLSWERAVMSWKGNRPKQGNLLVHCQPNAHAPIQREYMC